MVWAALAAAAILAALLLGSRKHKESQALLVSRLRTSGMYGGVAGMLKSLDSDLV